MAFTEEQLTALQEAYASGELRVSYNGKTVEYRSLDDLGKALRVVTDALNQAAGKTPVRVVQIQMTKGT